MNKSPAAAAKIRVLVIDDKAEMCEMVCDILGLVDDFEVVGTARSGFEGIALALRLRPDVVLMDYSMPKLDGIQATRRLIQLLPDSVIIMLSIYHDAALIEAAWQAGAQGYFPKPIVSFEELYATIRVAHRQRVGRSVPAD